MRRIGRWLLQSPGYIWVAGWLAVFVLAKASNAEGAVAWVISVVVWLLSLAALAVLVRLIIRWAHAGTVKRVLAWGIVLLIGLFLVQRLIAPSDSAEIEDAIEAAATSTDPSYCDEYLTSTYLVQSTGVEQPFADDFCERDAEIPGADSVEVSEIEIDGDRATALVESHGGGFDGARRVTELVKEDGDWKLNRLLKFNAFDRERFDRGHIESFVKAGFPASAGECAVASLRKFSAAEVQQMYVDGNFTVLDRITVHCDRADVERNLIEPFGRPPYEFPPELVDCIETRIKALPDDQVAQLTTDFVAYSRLLFECDQAAVFAYLERELSGYEDLDSEGVECVLTELRTLPSDEIVGLTYDQDRYYELIESCES